MTIENLQIDEVNCFENIRGKVVNISWSANIGFGELTLYQQSEDGKWKAHTECMCNNDDKEFIRMVLNKWVDEMEIKG